MAPIVNDSSRILILGSLPSDKSIKLNEYYGNKTNQFWNILSMVISNKKISFNDYNEKINFLYINHIALWDIFSSAERVGSLDTNIKNQNFNNISLFLKNFSNINLILLNGKKSQTAFEQYIKKEHISINYKYVPSSSSANTTYSLFEKVNCWKKIISCS